MDIDGTLYHKGKQVDGEHAIPEISRNVQTFANNVADWFGEEAMFQFLGACENIPCKTEDDLPALLKRWSDGGVLIVPFTARSEIEATDTERQLKDLGYDFSLWNRGKDLFHLIFMMAYKS